MTVDEDDFTFSGTLIEVPDIDLIAVSGLHLTDLWNRAGLPYCQRLANDMQSQAERFAHLDASQLLKHALGLGTNLHGQFSLWYLWYDWPSRESEKHRREVERFAVRVGSELRFRALTYQELFRALRQRCGADHSAYVGYLQSRYILDAA